MPDDPSTYLHTISRPGLRHGPLDRLLRAAAKEFVDDHRNNARPPHDGLRTGAVDLVAFARDVNETEFSAALMSLIVMRDCGREAVRSGLYALLDTATRLGLDRQTALPTAAMSELSRDGGYCPNAETLADVLADVLPAGDPMASVDIARTWNPQQRAVVWAWASKIWACTQPSPDVPARPDILKSGE